MTNQALLRHKTGDYGRHAEDWYVEPGWTWDVLFDKVPFVGSALDPACGGGTGLDALRRHGFDPLGSDIVDRGCGAHIHDFLEPDYPLLADNVITNPPYKLAEAFAERALEIGAKSVALLVPLPFLASQRRHALFARTPVATVVILSRRPSMPPGGNVIEAKGGKEDYAWIVWRRWHRGPAAILWGMPNNKEEP